MAKARKAEKVLSGITPDQFNEAMSRYAINDANACKLIAKMDAEITKIREKYIGELDNLRTESEADYQVLKVYSVENKEVLFSEKRHIDTPHGKIGFRLGMPKLKTLPEYNWDKVLEKVIQLLPDYVRTKKEVDKEKLLGDRDDKIVSKALNEVGVYVDQDETFYVDLKKEEQPE